ncbi:hypothetical protein B4087_5000 [Bacillus cereus]|nr:MULTISPECIES: hypothetical protein [Bacillus]KLA12528.1 hypothetical protein B4087_5000 [Bacillus cereus]MCG3786585.1 hypothetical protein [Bacillus sp. UTDS19-33BHI26]
MFGIFKMFAHDIKVLSHDVIQVLKGTNHKQVMPTLIVAHDPIDKMVEKEMAQLKAIKDEKEYEDMSKYKGRIESVEKLHQVIDALETLNKKYVITKKIEYRILPFTDNKYPVTIWYVEEVDVPKKYSDGEEIVKLICHDCGTSVTGKRIYLEGKGCFHNLKHNTTIVPLDSDAK